MSTATSLATHRITRRIVRISGRTKTCFVKTGHNFDRRNEPRPIPDKFIKISGTRATTVRRSGMIDKTFEPIISIVEEAATRPNRIDARCSMSGETYKPIIRHLKTDLPARWDRIANNHVGRLQAFTQILSRGSDAFLRTHKKRKKEGQA
jgi:hypothetical protein